MPNWCSNELSISGEKAVLVRFLEGLKALPASYAEEKPITEPCYTLNSYVPVPAEIQAKPYSPNFSASIPSLQQECGYNWQSEHWGTKWDCFADSDFEFEMKRIWSELGAQPEGIVSVTLMFETAWSPIDAWVKKVGMQFPKLTFELHYMGEGASFGGVLVVEGDEVSERFYDDARIYQFAEDRADLTEIVEDFYYAALEYELESEGLNVMPSESDENEFQDWFTAVSDLLNEQIDTYFSGVIEAGYLTTETLFNLTMNHVKRCLAS